MKIQVHQLVILLLCLVIYSTVDAAQRVLIRFGESGFAVVTVANVHGINLNQASDSDAARLDGRFTSVSDAARSLEPGQALLIWQDKSFKWLHVSSFNDPRIVQSPMHASSLIDSRAGLTSGAWIADGPDEAAHVILLLAENQPLGLPSEQWPLWLHD